MPANTHGIPTAAEVSLYHVMYYNCTGKCFKDGPLIELHCCYQDIDIRFRLAKLVACVGCRISPVQIWVHERF